MKPVDQTLETPFNGIYAVHGFPIFLFILNAVAGVTGSCAGKLLLRVSHISSTILTIIYCWILMAGNSASCQ
jgi:hypothetical protein